MLNSYGVGRTDLESKLRSDVLVGEPGFSEETGLMAPSVELDPLQVHVKTIFVFSHGKFLLDLWFCGGAALFVCFYIFFFLSLIPFTPSSVCL